MNKIFGIKQLKHQATVQSANYFCSKKDNLNIDTIHALLFLSDRYHLKKYRRTITGSNYTFNKNRPPINNTFEKTVKTL